MATSKYSLGVGLVGEEDARRPTLHAADVASASLQHRNPMTLAQLEERMRGWLTSGEYRAVLFEDNHEVVAYALFPGTDAEIYLRQFFLVPDRRGEGIRRRAMGELISKPWPRHKRSTVSALVRNVAGGAFSRAMGCADYELALEIMPRV